MTKAGADIIVAHMGVTTGGTIGATSAKSLDDCVARDRRDRGRRARACARTSSLLCHGGPISMPDDARYILERADGLHGFYGALEHGAPAGRSRDRASRRRASRA